MEEIKGVPDLSVRFSSSKNNIQLNSKLSGSQNINFQEILINVGEPNQTSVINPNNQGINIDSLQQNNDNELSQNNENKNINNDKNASTSIKSENNSSANTSLFSEYIPQKPVEVENKNLNLNSGENKENPFLNKYQKKTTKSNIKIKQKANIVHHEKSNIKENNLNVGTHKDEQNNLSIPIKKESNNIQNSDIKNPVFEDKDEERKNKQVFYYEDEEINSDDISEILNNYGLEIPEFISKGGETRDENWVKNLIFGTLSEKVNDDDIDKISKFITITNPEKIAEKDKKVFTKLVNEMFKHQIQNINPDILNRFEKNSSEFILKNFPHIIYNGVLKKYFDNTDDNVKNSRLKMLISFINNEKIADDDIKNSFLDNQLQENEKENLNYLLRGEYNNLNNEEIYKSINLSKDIGISFGSFTDNMHQIIVEEHENKLNERFKQTVKILNDYRQYNFIKENESHFLASSIVNRFFNNVTLSNNKLTELVTNLINGDYVEPLYLDVINQSLSKNLLSYLPNTINYNVSEYLKAIPFYKNEVEINEDKETFKFFIKIKSSIQISNINIYNNDSLELLNYKTTDKNILFIDLETGSYKIKSFESNEKKIFDVSKFDKNFSLDFSVDKKTDIFYFGSIELKYNKSNDSILFKLKNEYQNFLNNYKKKCPDLFKKNLLKINPKLFK